MKSWASAQKYRVQDSSEDSSEDSSRYRQSLLGRGFRLRCWREIFFDQSANISAHSRNICHFAGDNHHHRRRGTPERVGPRLPRMAQLLRRAVNPSFG